MSVELRLGGEQRDVSAALKEVVSAFSGKCIEKRVCVYIYMSPIPLGSI